MKKTSELNMIQKTNKTLNPEMLYSWMEKLNIYLKFFIYCIITCDLKLTPIIINDNIL